MDRRAFIASAGAVSLAGLTGTVRAGADFDPVELGFDALQKALATRAVTSEALTAAYLARIARFDAHGPEYRAVLALNPDALAHAHDLDRERATGKVRGPLHGLPILVKDNIETADPVSTTAGSWALAASRRGDAPLIARLRAAGAIVLGKTNLSEWANFRSTRATSGWSGIGGQTRHAYAPDRNPSGSSAGSAVAAAASFCAGAIGTETNGSILSPASLNGLVGLKPTVGLVSGRGVVPISPVQDTAGPMCRSVADAAALLRVMAERAPGFGRHGNDLEAFRLRGVRVGVMPVPGSAHPDTTGLFGAARSAFEREGAVLIELKDPQAFEDIEGHSLEALLYEFKASINEYLAGLDPAQVPSRTLADLIAFNRAHAGQELVVFGQELFERAEAKGPLSDPAYLEARAALTRATDTAGLATLLGAQGIDVLLAPCNGPAEITDPVWGDRDGGGWPQIASAAAIAGYPSITVPAGLVAGLPVGIALVAPRHQDGLLLQVARAFERATQARVPPRLGVA